MVLILRGVAQTLRNARCSRHRAVMGTNVQEGTRRDLQSPSAFQATGVLQLKAYQYKMKKGRVQRTRRATPPCDWPGSACCLLLPFCTVFTHYV